MGSRILALSLSVLATLALAFTVTRSVELSLSDARPGLGNQDSAAVVSPVASIAPCIGETANVSIEAAPRRAPAEFDPAARPIDVSRRQFDRLTARGLVLVKFGAPWCGPCQRVDSELEQLAQDNAGELTVLNVDVDEERRLSEQHHVGPIPHMILLRDGKQLDQWTGYRSAGRLQKAIDRAKPPKGKVQANPFTS